MRLTDTGKALLFLPVVMAGCVVIVFLFAALGGG